MKCPKCFGRGFIEYEHGLIMQECSDCKGTGEIDDIESFQDVTAEANAIANTLMPRLEGEPTIGVIEPGENVIPLEALSDIDSGARPTDKPVRSRDSSQPKRTRKSKAKKTARKRSS